MWEKMKLEKVRVKEMVGEGCICVCIIQGFDATVSTLVLTE